MAEAQTKTGMTLKEMLTEVDALESKYGDKFITLVKDPATKDAAVIYLGKMNLTLYNAIGNHTISGAPTAGHADAAQKMTNESMESVIKLLQGAAYVEKAVGEKNRTGIENKINSADIAQKYNELEKELSTYKQENATLKDALLNAQSAPKNAELTPDIVSKYLSEADLDKIQSVSDNLVTSKSLFQLLDAKKIADLAKKLESYNEVVTNYNEAQEKIKRFNDDLSANSISFLINALNSGDETTFNKIMSEVKTEGRYAIVDKQNIPAQQDVSQYVTEIEKLTNELATSRENNDKCETELKSSNNSNLELIDQIGKLKEEINTYKSAKDQSEIKVAEEVNPSV